MFFGATLLSRSYRNAIDVHRRGDAELARRDGLRFAIGAFLLHSGSGDLGFYDTAFPVVPSIVNQTVTAGASLDNEKDIRSEGSLPSYSTGQIPPSAFFSSFFLLDVSPPKSALLGQHFEKFLFLFRTSSRAA